jgi:hypothetical protein
MKVENEKFPWWVTHQKFSIMDYVWKVLHDGPLMTNSPCRTSHETFSMMDYSRKVLHFHHSIIRHSPRNGRRLDSPLYLSVAIQKSAKLTHENFSIYMIHEKISVSEPLWPRRRKLRPRTSPAGGRTSTSDHLIFNLDDILSSSFIQFSSNSFIIYPIQNAVKFSRNALILLIGIWTLVNIYIVVCLFFYRYSKIMRRSYLDRLPVCQHL